MNVHHFHMLGSSYFTSPVYLVVKVLFRATVLFPYFIHITDTNVCVYVKMFPGVAVHCTTDTPCHCIVAVVDVHILLLLPHALLCNTKFLFCSHSPYVRHYVAPIFTTWHNFLHVVFLFFAQYLCMLCMFCDLAY